MTTGSGVYISLQEKNNEIQNRAIMQLAQGRSNAVGTATLTNDASATSTAVTAVTSGPNSIVNLTPQTAAAAAVMATTYVKAADVTPGKFIITHAATSTGGITFGWQIVG